MDKRRIFTIEVSDDLTLDEVKAIFEAAKIENRKPTKTNNTDNRTEARINLHHYFYESNLSEDQCEKYERILDNCLHNVKRKFKLFETILTIQTIEYLKRKDINPSYMHGFKFTSLCNVIKIIYENLNIIHLVGVQPKWNPTEAAKLLQFETPQKNPHKMLLKINLHDIECKVKKLQMRWQFMSPDEKQKLIVTHGIDIEHEMIYSIGMGIARELNQEFLKIMRSNSTEREITLKKPEHLLIYLNKTANEIANTSKRGAANFIVMSAYTYSIFQGAIKEYENNRKIEGILSETPNNKAPIFVGKNDEKQNGICSCVGIFNASIKVYVDEDRELEKGEILVGYKGADEIDTGIVFAPGILIDLDETVMDAATFQISHHLRSKYGTVVAHNAKEYYTTIVLQDGEG